MHVTFAVAKVGREHQWTSRRGRNKTNHRYNRRRQCLRQMAEYLRAIRKGNFLLEGLTVAEREFVADILNR